LAVWVVPSGLADAPARSQRSGVDPDALFDTDLDADFDAQGNLTISLHGSSTSMDLDQLERTLNDMVGSTIEHVVKAKGPGSWMLAGQFRHTLRKAGLTCDGTINLAPLYEFLRRHKIANVRFNIRHTMTPVSECEPAFQATPALFSRAYVFVGPAASAPEAIRLQFGYRPENLQRLLLPGSILVLAVLVTCLMRRRALRAASRDPPVVWHQYADFLEWLMYGIWLAWFAGFAVSSSGALVDFVFYRGSIFDALVLVPAFWLLPPCAAIVVCKGLSHAVYARVRQAKWTPGDSPRAHP
jgi:hypothetical protein